MVTARDLAWIKSSVFTLERDDFFKEWDVLGVVAADAESLPTNIGFGLLISSFDVDWFDDGWGNDTFLATVVVDLRLLDAVIFEPLSFNSFLAPLILEVCTALKSLFAFLVLILWRDVAVCDVTASDIRARDITARDVVVRDVAAGNVAASDLAVGDFSARDITERDLAVRDVEARGLAARAVEECPPLRALRDTAFSPMCDTPIAALTAFVSLRPPFPYLCGIARTVLPAKFLEWLSGNTFFSSPPLVFVLLRGAIDTFRCFSVLLDAAMAAVCSRSVLSFLIGLASTSTLRETSVGWLAFSDGPK